jgi:hypothetical protein
VAVSIHSNLDLAQLLSKRPSGDSANSSKTSAKIGSDADPQWNGVPQLSISDATDPEQLFSNALQNALAAASADASNTPPAPAANQSGKQTINLPSPAPAVPAANSDSNSQALITLLLSAQKITDPKLTQNPSDSDDVKQLPAADPSSPAGALAYLAVATPVASEPLLPVATDSTAAKAGTNQMTLPVSSSIAAAAASGAAPGALVDNPNIPTASEAIVFDGHLTTSPKQDAAPPLPAQPVSSPISNVNASPAVQTAAQPAQPTAAVPQQSQSAQPRPPANTNISAPSVDATAAPAVSNGNATGKNSSFGQEMKQDGKSSAQSQAPVLPSTPHSTASANFPPQGAQNNLNSAQQTSASSNGNTQPIVNQSASVQTNVKTDMNLKMQSQSGDNITVRLSERAGGIQVTVRSSDPTTSAMLRHELPNIQAGLEQAGLQLTGTLAQHAPQQHSNGNHSQAGDQGGNDQRSGYGAQEQQKRRNNSQHQWFEMMQ